MPVQVLLFVGSNARVQGCLVTETITSATLATIKQVQPAEPRFQAPPAHYSASAQCTSSLSAGHNPGPPHCSPDLHPGSLPTSCPTSRDHCVQSDACAASAAGRDDLQAGIPAMAAMSSPGMPILFDAPAASASCSQSLDRGCPGACEQPSCSSPILEHMSRAAAGPSDNTCGSATAGLGPTSAKLQHMHSSGFEVAAGQSSSCSMAADPDGQPVGAAASPPASKLGWLQDQPSCRPGHSSQPASVRQQGAGAAHECSMRHCRSAPPDLPSGSQAGHSSQPASVRQQSAGAAHEHSRWQCRSAPLDLPSGSQEAACGAENAPRTGASNAGCSADSGSHPSCRTAGPAGGDEPSTASAACLPAAGHPKRQHRPARGKEHRAVQPSPLQRWLSTGSLRKVSSLQCRCKLPLLPPGAGGTFPVLWYQPVITGPFICNEATA